MFGGKSYDGNKLLQRVGWIWQRSDVVDDKASEKAVHHQHQQSHTQHVAQARWAFRLC